MKPLSQHVYALIGRVEEAWKYRSARATIRKADGMGRGMDYTGCSNDNNKVHNLVQ